jgi:hypothetical protein
MLPWDESRYGEPKCFGPHLESYRGEEPVLDSYSDLEPRAENLAQARGL